MTPAYKMHYPLPSELSSRRLTRNYGEVLYNPTKLTSDMRITPTYKYMLGHFFIQFEILQHILSHQDRTSEAWLWMVDDPMNFGGDSDNILEIVIESHTTSQNWFVRWKLPPLINICLDYLFIRSDAL